MSNTNIANLIKNIILDVNDEAFFNDETDLVEEQVLDSLETITYLAKLEEEFDISISTDEYIEKNLSVIKNMISFIESRP